MKYGPYMKRQLKDLQKSYFIFTDETGKQQRQAIAVKNIEGKHLTDGFILQNIIFLKSSVEYTKWYVISLC